MMKPQLLFQRHELKYYISEQLYSRIINLIELYMELDSFSQKQQSKSYLVRSLYLDSFDKRFYNEKLIGLNTRKKLRFRGYNNDTSEVFLEIKRKYDNIIVKQRAQLEFDELPYILDGYRWYQAKGVLTSWHDIVINIIIAFMLGVATSRIYRHTHRGYSYSNSFVNTLTILSMVTAFVMMIIGNNIARAFSLVGALSIIRFRTAVKNTRDTAFVFLSLAIGMAVGTGSRLIAIMGTTVISLIILIMYLFNREVSNNGDFLLKFRIGVAPGNENIHQDVFDRYLKKSTLINSMTVQQGLSMESTFSVRFKDQKKQQHFLRELNALERVEHAMLTFAEEDLD